MMTESKEDDVDKELSEDSKSSKAHKKSRKMKNHDRRGSKDDKGKSGEKSTLDDAADEDDRAASFFTRSRRMGKKPSETESEQDSADRLWGESDLENQEDKKSAPKGLTEVEAKEAVSAIADGLSRELRNEFDQSTESTVAELEAVAAASFVDSLRDKVGAGNEDITEELLDEVLHEALEDLLGVDEGGAEIVDLDEGEDTDGNGSNIGGGNSSGGGNGGDNDGDHHSHSYPHGSAQLTAAVSAVVAANADIGDKSAGNENRRGKGLLIGGVVGYIVGQRHGRKRTETKLQPEVDQLEDQIAELYDALASREHMIRQVVQELAARQLGEKHTAELSALSADKLDRSSEGHRDASKAVKPPSLVVPVVFATLLVSKRLMTDVSNEQNTWGKDLLIGGVAGYMIGRRHGRKRTETRLKTEMEQLEDQVYGLQEDLISRDSVIDAVIRTTSEADHEVVERMDGSAPKISSSQGGRSATVGVRDEGGKEDGQPSSLEKQLVDVGMDRIVVSRKNREIKRHKKHLLESGRAAAVGEFNLLSSIQLERRLMDGTENSSARKQIEAMDEDELLAMSQNIYVDGESAIDLYDRGRVKLEVLRESVTQFWRRTGNYEQTLRTNLEKDESAVDDIRTNLEKAYRSILENA